MSVRIRHPRQPVIALLQTITFAFITLCGWGAVLAQTPEPIEFVEIAPPDSQQLQAFHNAISGIESRQGAYAPLLPEQLLSLGLALQRKERHADAIDAFKRGSHLARINDGLYSPSQIPYIQNAIASHLALGQLAEADDIQARLFRVQQRNMTGDAIQAQALLRQASWQHQAYNMGAGDVDSSFARLLNMWDLYRMALTNIAEREGEASVNLLPPLYGMLRTQYLISGYRVIGGNPAFTTNSETGNRQTENRFYSYYSKSYSLGRSIIRAIYDIELASQGKNSLAVSRTRIMLGDWMLWHRDRDSAMALYAQAFGELEQLDDAQVQQDNFFGTPTALPDLAEIRSLPHEVEAHKGGILLEFGVDRHGKVVNLVRPNTDELGEAAQNQATRLVRTLRKTTFRPRFANGEAINTENIVKAYAIAP